MNGNLIVRVFIDSIAQPAENANVTIVGNGIHITAKTNELGQTAPISLPAPSLKLSLEPSNNIAYYSYDVKVDGLNLGTQEVLGVQIFPGITSIQDIYFSTIDNNKNTSVISIPDYYIGSYSPKIIEDPTSSSSRILNEVVIPEYIIVHEGLPSNTSGRNYQVPFIDYIKNVASSEIYPTWPREAIKANVLAIISFTLNRVYTEWYRSQGYNFTITSSTAYDHAFVYGREIYDTISEIVDEIFNYYIIYGENNFPFLAQYVDGRNVAAGPGIMSQWGSKELADQGYTAEQILKYYYTNNIRIAQAEFVEGLPVSYPGYTLQLGSCGSDVQTIQNMLNNIRTAYPAINIISNPNGQFNSDTQSAVKTFQQIFNLPETGIIDSATWYKISYIYTAINKLAEGIYA